MRARLTRVVDQALDRERLTRLLVNYQVAGQIQQPGRVTDGASSGSPLPPPRPRRFYGTVKLDTTRVGRDAGRIAEEIIQHLSTLSDSEVEVTLEIHARVSAGVPEDVERVVTENCRTLKFQSFGFEES